MYINRMHLLSKFVNHLLPIGLPYDSVYLVRYEYDPCTHDIDGKHCKKWMVVDS